ncbi:MAG: ribonuclease HI [Deltaproteobacteria bacterium]|nr:ribonuclease HI [Deltaproteobacteria bacterium]
MQQFTCQSCGKSFSVPQAALDKYPGWTPKSCLDCKGGGSRKKQRGGGSRATRTQSSATELLTPAEVLERYHDGPKSGIFVDGACSGNPGPGGWGVVWVENDDIREQRRGAAEETTNNRMELQALIVAYQLIPEDAELTIFSDSQLCVNTITQWAAGWEKNGWRRKSGPIKNLELVKEVYALAQAHPHVELRWIKAHAGSRWNEYADALATSYLRD